MLTYTRLEAGQAVAPFFLRVLRDASKNTAVVGQPRHGREYIKEEGERERELPDLSIRR